MAYWTGGKTSSRMHIVETCSIYLLFLRFHTRLSPLHCFYLTFRGNYTTFSWHRGKMNCCTGAACNSPKTGWAGARPPCQSAALPSTFQLTKAKAKKAKRKTRKKVSILRKGRKTYVAGAREEPTNRGSIAMENLNATPNALGWRRWDRPGISYRLRNRVR
jgi:hypothetical protein